ncbi:hypothetical protein AVEN_121337-1 [Araneus ventricosus]|uniref:Uncharacterized protein n=1 Tax=Araneus ventricosus TaxID=182803 RepID=A0A4Y2PJS7_ARAVE|nr:hypothetical protein AVEN_121337-1 [Araneus ventricosus]
MKYYLSKFEIGTLRNEIKYKKIRISMGLDFDPARTSGMGPELEKKFGIPIPFFLAQCKSCILHYRCPLRPYCHQRERKETEMNELSLQAQNISSRGVV